MANQLNEFDKLIKESYEQYEAPYDPAHWDELERELNKVSPGMTDYFKSISTGILVTGVIFMAMLFFFSDYSDNAKRVDEPTAEIESKEGLPVSSKGKIGNDVIVSIDSNEAATMGEAPETMGAESDDQVSSTSNVSVVTIAKESKTASSEESALAETALTSKPEVKSENSTAVRKGCTGLTINFDAPAQYGKDAKYLWNFGDGFFSNEPNPSHTFNKEGVFDVSLSVTSKSSGQISSNVVQAMIEVEEAPVSDFDAKIGSVDELILTDKSYRAKSSSWSTGNEESIHSKALSLPVEAGKTYDISLTAVNEAGCEDVYNQTVKVIKAGNQFPGAYSASYPTNFSPGAIVDSGNVLEFNVFNSGTGELVHTSSGSKGWDGTNQNEVSAAPGNYTWIMLVRSNSVIDVYKGTVELRK